MTSNPQISRMIFEQQNTRLRIADSRLPDSGNYSCEAANSAGNAIQHFVVHVGVAPKIIAVGPNEHIVAANGTRMDITCEAVGHPSPTIEWTVNGNAPVPQNHVRGNALVFSKLRFQDSGTYTCTARNWVASASKTVQLVVKSLPQVHPEHMNVTVKENGTAVFTCNVSGATGEVSWFKEPNLPIVSNQSKCWVDI